MNQGQICRLRTMAVWGGNREVQFSSTYKAPKGQVMVVCFLGVEPLDGSAPLDPELAMQIMGWQRARIGGVAPQAEEGRGELLVGLTPDEQRVVLQFPPGPSDQGWWIELTRDEACTLAETITRKADEVERGR